MKLGRSCTLNGQCRRWISTSKCVREQRSFALVKGECKILRLESLASFVAEHRSFSGFRSSFDSIHSGHCGLKTVSCLPQSWSQHSTDLNVANSEALSNTQLLKMAVLPFLLFAKSLLFTCSMYAVYLLAKRVLEHRVSENPPSVQTKTSDTQNAGRNSVRPPPRLPAPAAASKPVASWYRLDRETLVLGLAAAVTGIPVFCCGWLRTSQQSLAVLAIWASGVSCFRSGELGGCVEHEFRRLNPCSGLEMLWN